MTDGTSSTPASETPDSRTERVLEAAKAAFLELGYAATSMDLVAQRAKVSKTTLYTRFSSKEALFSATIARECAAHGMNFAADAFDGWPLAAALTEIGDRFLALIWSPEALRIHQVVTGEALRQPEVGQIFYEIAAAPTIAAVAGYFLRARETGLLSFDDLEFVTTQFLASLQGGPHCALTLGLGTAPGADDRRAFVARVVDLFISGIEGVR